ncbi:hypothetical protein ACOMHN_045348 [Nucella lapillus]
MALQTELDKYTRNFFTIPIPDIPELSAVARKTLGTGPVLAQPVCVEISLKMKENNAYIFLELWSLTLDVENCEPDVKVSISTLYGRMTSALKSILSISRVAPAYRLAQRQKKDDFQIHYQYSLGPPNVSLLCENVQNRRIGQVVTPAGAILVNLAYTTKPQMPQQTKPGVPLHPKIDHFSEPRTHQASEPKPCNRKFRNPTSVEDLQNLNYQQDTFNSTFSTSPPDGYVCSVSPPPLPQIDEASVTLSDSVDGGHKKQEKSPDVDPLDAYLRNPFFHDDGNPPVQIEKPEDCPFASLMAGLSVPDADASLDETISDTSSNEEKEGEGKGKEKKEESEDSEEEEEEEEKRNDSPGSSSYVMVPPMESPFQDTDNPTTLGEFYREMQKASLAQLSMCEQHTVSTDDFLADIKSQIDEFAAKQPEIDKFLKSLPKDKEEFSD